MIKMLNLKTFCPDLDPDSDSKCGFGSSNSIWIMILYPESTFDQTTFDFFRTIVLFLNCNISVNVVPEVKHKKHFIAFLRTDTVPVFFLVLMKNRKTFSFSASSFAHLLIFSY